MVDSRIDGLISDFKAGKVDRRNFVVRAVALGLSASAIGTHMRAAAQDSTPEASPSGGTELGPGTIGRLDVEHIESTDAGMIKLYIDTQDGAMSGLYVQKYMDSGLGGTP